MAKILAILLVFCCVSFAQESLYFKEYYDKIIEEKPRNCTGSCEVKYNEDAKKKAADEAAKKIAAEKAADEAAKKIAAEKAAEETAAKKAEETAVEKSEESEEKNKTEEEIVAKKAEEEKKTAEAAAINKAAETAKKTDEKKDLDIDMILIRGSFFTMGCSREQGYDCNEDERPAHNITNVHDFYISKYPITQKLWIRVMGSNPSYFEGPNLPVESVSWHDVQIFIRELNKLTGKKYRLLTEPEWEFAARGGRSSGRKYSGDDDIEKIAWFNSNSKSTHPVCSKQVNELGICDMSGNVLEWVQNWKGNYPTTEPINGTLRVNRGGSWQDGAMQCRVSKRNGNRPEYKAPNLGFRLALDK